MKNIDSKVLNSKLKQQQAIVIDVRTPAEYRSEHIPNSYLLPQDKVSIENLPKKNKTIVFVCRSGRRSVNVCEKFTINHPELDVYSLHGGINAWKEAGFSTISSGKTIISLDRQIQIVAGSLVLTGVIIGAFVNPWFYLISGFVGAGLLFAGISGWCGMGKLLSLMPWNK